MIIPAAGAGSRLGASVPKVLVPVAGRPMIDRLLGLYAGTAFRFTIVASPLGRDLLEAHLARTGASVEIVVQPEPTGMLDAILLVRDHVLRSEPDRVWITWCDQLAVHPGTIARLAEADTAGAEMVFPTCRVRTPYIHLERDGIGRIVAVRHRREGDPMPEFGESDIGLFSLSRDAYLRDLPAFEGAGGRGAATQERNFLPFIPWLSARRRVATFPCADPVEAVGINTPEDLRRIERHFQEAGTDRAR